MYIDYLPVIFWVVQAYYIFFLKEETLQGMFSDHSGIKLKIYSNAIYRKDHTVWKLKSTLLSNPKSKEETTWEIRKYFKLNKY